MKFPNEGKAYRVARDKLLRAEIALRKKIEAVAALRRKLPAGGSVPEDYVFEEAGRKSRLSELFVNGDTLIAYSFMYGPKASNPCPMCSSMLDALNGNARHIAERTDLVVIAKSPIGRILDFARSRGWNNLRLLSSEGNSYNADYHGEDDKGAQWPMMNVFVRRKGAIRHFWGSEMLAAKSEPGQNSRHVDLTWPLWSLLDLTPEGRGKDWYPKLDYRDVRELKGSIPKSAKPVGVADMNKAIRRHAVR
jgi:predicted dithiol-disulfide oxidoreductase (DUF899 family)